jgi:hypothetical protein
MVKILYRYHPVTKEYLGEVEAQEHPEKPGEYFEQAFATEFPPRLTDGFLSIWTGVEWELQKIVAQAKKEGPFEVEVGLILSAKAKELGYSSFETAISYANSTVKKWSSEAKSLIKWRDLLWNYYFGFVENDPVKSKKKFSEILPELPKFE